MDGKISRNTSHVTLTIASGAALSEAVDMREYAGGVLRLPAAWTAASLAFQHSDTANGTFQPLYKSDNSLVEMTVAASRDYALPDQLFGCAFVKLWSETAGSNVNQGADRAFALHLKG
jgi:hypothetical protein